MSDMLEAYESACAEDIALEAAMTVFGKKKQLSCASSNQRKISAKGSKSSMSRD